MNVRPRFSRIMRVFIDGPRVTTWSRRLDGRGQDDRGRENDENLLLFSSLVDDCSLPRSPEQTN